MYNKIISNLIRLFNNKNHPNIILYGHPNIDKFNILLEVLNNVYKMNDEININEGLIDYSKNNIYYKFDCNYIKYKNKQPWLDFLKSIINTDNHYTENKKIIILYNFHNLSKSIQNILKVLIEKNYHIKFIIISDTITDIIDPIKSRFLSIRIPLIDAYMKWKLVKTENITINEFLKHKHNNIDFIKSLIDINEISNHSIIDNIIYYIIKIIDNYKNKDTLLKIKGIIYIIITIGIPHKIFMQSFLIKLLEDHKIIGKKKFLLVKLFCEVDILYINSYYKVIHYEYLIMNIINIIKIR
jgi:DNA polymerase III delta prime subunit